MCYGVNQPIPGGCDPVVWATKVSRTENVGFLEELLDGILLFVLDYLRMNLYVPNRHSMLNIWWWDS